MIINEIITRDKISYEESKSIKGLLIFLIVLGHNRFFSGIVSDNVYGWLYTFHVYAFFLLPFFYPEKGIDKYRVKNNAVKLLYVYAVWFLIYAVVYAVMSYIVPSLSETGQCAVTQDVIQYPLALITGAQSLLGATSGFLVLWFLPVMFSMLLVKGLHEKYKAQKFWPILFVLGIICYVILIDFRYKSPISSEVVNIIDMISPISILRGLGAFIIGFITIKLYRKLNGGGSICVYI